MDELKPCPFCGGEAKVYGGRECYWVCCLNCKADMRISETREEAIDAWDRRATNESEGEHE